MAAAAEKHRSYLPHGGAVLAGMPGGALAGYGGSKGALRCPLAAPLRRARVDALLAPRLAEMER